MSRLSSSPPVSSPYPVHWDYSIPCLQQFRLHDSSHHKMQAHTFLQYRRSAPEFLFLISPVSYPPYRYPVSHYRKSLLPRYRKSQRNQQSAPDYKYRGRPRSRWDLPQCDLWHRSESGTAPVSAIHWYSTSHIAG